MLLPKVIDRKINYFHVPIMMKYKFDNHIYVKAGTQLGLSLARLMMNSKVIIMGKTWFIKM